MNLKTARLVRTPHSEQYALFDLDRTDENFDPLSVGKLDIHYTQQGLYGTLLFWEEADAGDSWEDIVAQAELLLAEFQTPMGVPAEYAIEFFTPSLKKYELLSNIDPADASADAGSRADEIDATAMDRRPIWSLPTLPAVFEERTNGEAHVGDSGVAETGDDWPSRVSRQSGLPDPSRRAAS